MAHNHWELSTADAEVPHPDPFKGELALQQGSAAAMPPAVGSFGFCLSHGRASLWLQPPRAAHTYSVV